MSSYTRTVILDYSALRRCCRTSKKESDIFRDTISGLTKKATLIVERNTWMSFERAVHDRMSIIKFLLDGATESMREENSLIYFKSEYANYTKISQQISGSLNIGQTEEIRDLRKDAEKFGLREFRSELDTRLRNCDAAYNLLDKCIDSRVRPECNIRWEKKAAIDQISSNETEKNTLSCAHCESRTTDVMILSADGDGLYNKCEDIYDRLGTAGDGPFQVHCPSEVESVL